jgi:hypothetical protein
MALKFPQQRKHAQRIEKYIHDSHVMLTFLMAIFSKRDLLASSYEFFYCPDVD